MSTYAIGAVLGRHDLLQGLLQTLGFDPERDRLWFSGDLVSGPDTAAGDGSLEVLRFVQGLGKQAVTVLGDLDLKFLTRLAGGDLLAELPEREALVTWLRRRGFVHYDPARAVLMVHAGLPAEWTPSQALTHAYELESAMSQGDYLTVLDNLAGEDQKRWSAKLRGWKRLRFLANALTRMRYCNDEGRMDFHDGPLGTQPEGYVPWYRIAGRATGQLKVLFGHGADMGDAEFPGAWPLWASGADALAARNLDAGGAVTMFGGQG